MARTGHVLPVKMASDADPQQSFTLVLIQTRVLVTHGLTYLPKVDHVIVLKDGRVSEQGTYQDLLNEEGGAFAELVRTYLTENSDEDDLDPEGGANLTLILSSEHKFVPCSISGNNNKTRPHS